MNALAFLAARLKEPSTYAAIAAILTSFGVSMDPGALKIATDVGIAASAVLGFILAERTGGKSVEQIAIDAAAAARVAVQNTQKP